MPLDDVEEHLVLTRLRRGVRIYGGWFAEPSFQSLKALSRISSGWARKALRRVLRELIERDPSLFLLLLLGE